MDQIGLNLIQVDQTCSNWIKLDQIGSNWIKLHKNVQCSNCVNCTNCDIFQDIPTLILLSQVFEKRVVVLLKREKSEQKTETTI